MPIKSFPDEGEVFHRFFTELSTEIDKFSTEIFQLIKVYFYRLRETHAFEVADAYFESWN
jgi:hypothetical protein